MIQPLPFVHTSQPNNYKSLVPNSMTNYVALVPQQPSQLESTMASMMKKQEDFIQQQHQTNLSQSQTNQFYLQATAKLEMSPSQIASSLGDRKKGKLPSQLFSIREL